MKGPKYLRGKGGPKYMKGDGRGGGLNTKRGTQYLKGDHILEVDTGLKKYFGWGINLNHFSPPKIILGRTLSTTVNLASLVGFGASLASQVDVDGNTYNGEPHPFIVLFFSNQSTEMEPFFFP